MTNDLDHFIVPYFQRVCKEEMSALFSSLGLDTLREYSASCVWIGRGMFSEISHLPETSPNYEIQIVFGTGDARYDVTGRIQFVPLWALFERSREEELAKLLRFSTEEDLRRALNTSKSEFFPGTVDRLLTDRQTIEEAIAKLSDRFAESHAEQSDAPSKLR